MSSASTKAKPTLAGTNIKVRKGAANKAAKYEPAVFRNAVIQQLETVADPTDFDAYAKKLDELGNSLDFRKYEGELFQLLLLGRLIAPGGSALNDGAPPSPFSLLASANKEPADLPQVKQVVDVFYKLIRRFKYLQKDFEETSLPSVLQHVNKYDGQAAVPSGANTPTAAPKSLPVPEGVASEFSQPPSRAATPTTGLVTSAKPNQDKLAMATACFVNLGLATPAVLSSVRKDHLVKDGSAATFLAVYLKTFIANEGLDALILSLRKSGMVDLLAFFPANRRTFPEMAAFFKANKLEAVTEVYQKHRGAEISRETLAHLKEMVAGTESNEEIIAFLKQQEKTKAISEADFITLVWKGIVSVVDVKPEDADAKEDAPDGAAAKPADPAAATNHLLKELKELSSVLEVFCQNARTEIALINSVQVWCYDNSAFQNAFVKILLTLFNNDVLSAPAIIYWHSKGSKPQGRQNFLKAAEPLVKKLQEQEDEDDDEDE